ncbi:hypothetical protein BGX27_009531 [Mortierella sp. AM989]|nr:hypothetical protein BGX27_009531 [Mortierella sp. AM989]
MPAAALPTLNDRLLALVKGPQFIWWLGHVTMLVCTAFYLPYWFTFNYKAGGHWYTRAFFGALVSYSVVVYKSFPENVQYLLMAFFWWRSTPMLAPLIPYAIFAFFNSLNYARTNIIPALFPAPPAGTTSTTHAQIANISNKIQVWTEKNHAAAMAFVAYVEVVGVMGSLIFGAITFQSSFLSPIVYANFLRFRYFFSLHTRAAFALIRARLDNLIVPQGGNPSVPPVVAQAYTAVRGAITRFGQAAVQQPAAGAQARAR